MVETFAGQTFAVMNKINFSQYVKYRGKMLKLGKSKIFSKWKFLTSKYTKYTLFILIFFLYFRFDSLIFARKYLIIKTCFTKLYYYMKLIFRTRKCWFEHIFLYQIKRPKNTRSELIFIRKKINSEYLTKKSILIYFRKQSLWKTKFSIN